MEWRRGGLEEALAQAAREGRRVALLLGASWCDDCEDLHRQVLGRPHAAVLFAEAVRVYLDFDHDGAAALVERLAIVELPTLVVLRPDGAEAARVSGFERPGPWLEAARAALVADDEVAQLLAELARGTDDRALELELGERLLARSPEDGHARLERLAFGDDTLAARALFLLARYHHRARRDPGTARGYWRELALRFHHGPTAKAASHGYAHAQAELGRPELGAALLEARVARSPSPEAVLDWASFVDEHPLAEARARVRAAALAVLERARGPQRDALEELVLRG